MIRTDVEKNDSSKAKFNIPGFGALNSIRMGPGVVGRTAPVAVSLIILFLVAIWSVRSYPLLVVGLSVFAGLIVAGYFGIAFWYANKHPSYSTLEGSELVRFREIEQAAKEPTTIDLAAAPVANTRPPLVITNEGPDGA